MRLAYLEAFSGISGDMLLGAFIHAGVSSEMFHETTAALKVGATLDIQEVDRSGIQAIKVNVLVDGKPATADSAHRHGHGHEARSLNKIRALINEASLPKPVQATAISAFELLGASEAKIHNVPIESIHFHEVGAVDAIIDVVLTATAAHALQIDEWHCSPLNVGGGTLQCAHGRFPVPAPATADLLRGAPTYSSGNEGELVTPTGAALVRALDCLFGPWPAMRVESIGYGAGTRNPSGFANVLRLSIGAAHHEADSSSKTVTVLETALDDLNPQVIAYVTEQALRLGALDVMCTPVQMKKNRPGTLLTILSDRKNVPGLEEFIFRETSTLGLRVREELRCSLERRHVPVVTEWGVIRIKAGFWKGQEVNAAPEFEDCRQVAEARAVPVKRVLETALQAYRQRTT
jgi:pyridinium-3,5-bisthiocarboxylic acid mononucleotide nickel chelatase